MHTPPSIQIDALPLILPGGISNYLRPLFEQLAGDGVPMDWLFRLGIAGELGRAYRDYRAQHAGWPVRWRAVRGPQRWICALWERGIGIPAPERTGGTRIFLATTDLVPRLRRPGIRVGWVVYDLTPARVPRFFGGAADAWLDRFRERLSRTDFVIAISQATKRDLIELAGYPEDRIHVIYPGAPVVDMGRVVPRPSLPVARPYVIYLGSLALNKNVDGLIRIFARCVNERGIDMDLVLTGKDFQGAAYWRDLIREQRVEGRVHLTGWVTEVERERLLRHATMLWHFSWYEGFGLPVLEAAAHGIPVLTSDRGSLPEIMLNAEQTVNPDDEDQAVARAAHALKEPALREHWRAQGLKRAGAFVWSQSAAQLVRETLRRASPATQNIQHATRNIQGK